MSHSRTPRELRYWDHKKHGPVPDWYWEERARQAKILDDEQQRNSKLVACLVIGGSVALVVVIIVMVATGYGPA